MSCWLGITGRGIIYLNFLQSTKVTRPTFVGLELRFGLHHSVHVLDFDSYDTYSSNYAL